VCFRGFLAISVEPHKKLDELRSVLGARACSDNLKAVIQRGIEQVSVLTGECMVRHTG
jgi:hypothetical protein